MKKALLAACLTILALQPTTHARAEQLPVNLGASKITVDIQSSLINTTATLKKFSGYLQHTGNDLTNAKVVLTSKGSDVSFGRLPIEQMFFVSSLMQAVSSDEISFESQSIERVKEQYLIHGITTSGKHQERISIPVMIAKDAAKKRYTFITQYQRSGTAGNKSSQLGQMLGPISTKGNIQIVFGS
jgi:polyisoprenoid-binding protein YceI